MFVEFVGITYDISMIFIWVLIFFITEMDGVSFDA